MVDACIRVTVHACIASYVEPAAARATYSAKEELQVARQPSSKNMFAGVVEPQEFSIRIAKGFRAAPRALSTCRRSFQDVLDNNVT